MVWRKLQAFHFYQLRRTYGDHEANVQGAVSANGSEQLHNREEEEEEEEGQHDGTITLDT